MSFTKKDICHFCLYKMTCHLYVISKITKMTKMCDMSFLNFGRYDIKMTKYGKNDKQMTKMGVVCLINILKLLS